MSLRMITIANTALHTQRSALEVIGHNVANAETPGYVRQRPVIAAIPGVTRNDAGGGAELVAINLLRDELLATQIRHESGLLGRDSGLRNTLVQVEQTFTDVTSGGLAQRIEEMFDAWGDLGLQPSSTAARQQVLERSHLAAESISHRWEALAGLRREVDQRLNALVDRVNMLAREVAEINAKLPGTGSLSGRNDLETRRNGIINQLADLCGAEVVRQEGGVVDVIIGGRRLVDHASVTELSLVDDPAQPGLHLIALGDEVSPDGLRGEIAGRLQARDEIIPRYLDQLDALASGLADAVNAQHLAGIDLAGNAGSGFFSYDPARPAATLTVSSTIAGDPTLIAASQSATTESDGSNAMAIDDLRNHRLLSAGTATCSQFSADLISTVGIDAQAAQTRLDSRQILVRRLQDEYANQAGVSLDEEALELMRYEQAYMAASRLMNTALEMMDAILQLA